ncbi:hypothetical protein C8R44DRAFT_976360 [Mycena epipterygia]|nr:hypothetical protein C8R44DRAFT_976360 [Mycena epipterygia]
MKFSTAFFALVPLVAALPAVHNTEASNTTAVISARIQGNVFVCVNAGFNIPCDVFHGSSGQCVNFPSSFNDNISAVGPDSDQDCFFFMQVFVKQPNDAGCSGASLGPIRNPGIANLNVPPTVPFNDHISSFRCFFG